MNRHSTITRTTLLKFLPLDAIFVILLPFAASSSLGVGLGEMFASAIPLSLVREIGLSMWVSAMLAPAQAWFRMRPAARSEAATLRAMRALASAPLRISVAYGLGHMLTLVLSAALALWLFPEQDLSPRILWVSVALGLATLLGAPVLSYPLFQVLNAEASLDVAREAAARGIESELPPSSLRTRIGLLAMLLAIAPFPWVAGIGYRSGLDSAREGAKAATRADVLEIARDLRDAPVSGQALARYAAPDVAVAVVSSDGRTHVGSAELVSVATGRLPQGDAGSLGSRDLVWARERIDAQRSVIVVRHVSDDAGAGFLIAMAAFLVVIAAWAPLSATLFAQAIASGVKRLADASARIVDVGDLEAIGDLPIVQEDEVGATTRNFNSLLGSLRTVAAGAKRVADGDLTVTIEGIGELPDAFRGMVSKLAATVAQLRSTSVELATAATEIYSAAQEQEAASTEQSGGMTEVTHTMQSLAQSSAHVAESVGGVLRDAERARENTALTAERISELNRHSQRISELLDVIREVAEKTDLLALNGSLEATRAGESGRGFSLVAGEMRRLAERVKATVEDVKTLVADVRASGAATVMATDQSRKLVESTSEAARRITHVSQQQSSATEAVSASVRDIANVLAQAAAATTQTRVAAEGLKLQAKQLEELVSAFHLERRAS